MIYAPVIIPTLNRYVHFRNCLESLEACTGAEFTDVYIALDYPPSDKYIDGWKKNNEYLNFKEKSNKFKSLTVYRRKENYFFSGKGNGKTAIKDLPDTFDRYIFSEDDNIFSPNFLEYINKGLEMFKNDTSILAICGYCHPYDIKVTDNNYFMQNVDFSAWGYGMWKNRDEICRAALVPKYYRKKMFSLFNIYKLKNNGLNRLLYAFKCAYGLKKIPSSDNTLSVYMALEDMNVVMPVVTKVRNTGWDGSGIHCHDAGELKTIHFNQKIDKSRHFDFIGDGKCNYDDNRKVFVKSSYARCTCVNFIKSFVGIFVKKLFK